MPELTAAARAGARASARKPLSASAPLLLGLALHPGAAGVLEVHSLPLTVPIGAFRRLNARRPILKENRRCPNGCRLRAVAASNLRLPFVCFQEVPAVEPERHCRFRGRCLRRTQVEGTS